MSAYVVETVRLALVHVPAQKELEVRAALPYSQYVSIRQHTSAYVPAKEEPEVRAAVLYGDDVVACASVRRVPCFAILVVSNKQPPQVHVL
jgi:hypothetical protein